MSLQVPAGVVLLLVAAVVAMLARKFRLPYSVGLVASGILLALLPLPFHFSLTKDLIFTLLLPPLLFEAAYKLEWASLRRNLPLVGTLALPGVLISALATAAGLRLILHWPWTAALLFGSLIAATDPVSVLATLKEAGAKGRLPLILEAESLLNDGTAAVVFGVVLVWTQSGSFSFARAAVMTLTSIAGGILFGLLVAFAALWMIGKTQDPLVEITFTVIAAYGAFLLADHCGTSGVLATIAAGLLMGNGQATLSARGKEATEDFWDYAAFLSNSVIFLLIGVHEAHQNFAAYWLAAVVAIVAVLLARVLAVLPCCALFARSTLRLPAAQQAVLCWGGLRGALALALALGLAENAPMREEILAATFATVAFSIFAQGLTMEPFLRRIGALPPRS